MKLKPSYIIPFRLKNISDFLVRDHPIYFPESLQYKEYWTEQARRCVEGFWGHDYNTAEGGGWRFMPGNLYFYVNFVPILQEGDGGTEVRGFPLLRDIDWLQFYAYLVCDGFAGFADDEQYTCYRPVGKLANNEKLTNKEKRFIQTHDKHLRKPDGTLKTYIHARDYLYQTFSKPMGHALFLNEAQNVIIFGSRGTGKDLWEESIVYTEKGPTQIKNIKLGDKVYGDDGKLTTVIDVAKYYNQMQYEVEFDDGRVVTCGGGHLWEVYVPGSTEPQVLPLKEIMKRYKGYFRSTKRGHDPKFFIKICEPVQFLKTDLPLDPYFLGMWLGDGNSHNPSITTMDVEVSDYIYKMAKEFDCTVTIKDSQDNGKAKTYNIIKPDGSHTNPVTRILEDTLGVLNNKHIPEQYLHASYDDRLALLQGLLDTDGSCDKRGYIEFSSKFEHLAKEVVYLCQSLGIRASLSSRRLTYMQGPDKRVISFKEENGRVYYRVGIRTGLPVFKIKRKLERILKEPKSQHQITLRGKLSIRDIRPVGVKPSICIGVNNENNLFLTDNFIVTHNSLGTSGGIIQYDFTFNGARTLSDFLEQKTSTTVVVGSTNSQKTKELLDKFSSGYEYLRTHIGAYRDGDYIEHGCFWRPFEGSTELNKSITNRVKIKGGKGYDGPGSKIVHVSYAQSASAGVGYRARRMVCEEIGLAANFKRIHSENSASQKRETKFGYTVYLGTGGDIEKVREVRDAFYNPEAYDCIPFPDVFNGTGKNISLFIPCYYRSALYKDENGNTDVQKAFEDEMYERDKKRTEGSKAYEGHIISYPILPQEMFMQSGGNAFPTDLIEDRINELETTGEYKKYSVGTLHYITVRNSACEWKEDTRRDFKPVLRYGEEDNMLDKRGAIVVYEHPKDNKPDPTFRTPLYLVAYDPVAKDGIGTSLCCVLVFKMWDIGYADDMQFTVVAEWFGRHERQEDNHEMAFKLAAYYGAKILPEVNNTDVIRYALMTNRYNWLQPRPGLALDGMLKQRKYEVGIKISPGMIPHLEAALAEYAISPIDTTTFIDGEDITVFEKKAISAMRSLRILEEMLYYNRDDNFDGVSCMFLLATWVRQQKQEPLQYEVTENFNEESRALKQLFKPAQSKGHPAFNY